MTTLLKVGKRYRVVYQLPGRRTADEMVAEYLGEETWAGGRTVTVWSGRPAFGTTRISLKDLAEATPTKDEPHAPRRKKK